MLRWYWTVMMLVVLVACQPENTVGINGPVLVQEVTVAATDVRPTTFLSPTATQPARPTSEVVSPLDAVTVDASFVIVTPTLPPSKTPTPTSTQTETPTITPTTTQTNTATSTAFFLPTSEIISITEPASANADRLCDTNWFFIEPEPEGCPLFPPTASNGVYQRFQFGYMVWVGSLEAIYVLYTDLNQPRWEVYRDFFDENNPTMAYLDGDPESIAGGYWTPRRGFGLLWRQNLDVQNRIGAAAQQWEQPFSVQVQTGNDGTLFISTPETFIFSLIGNGTNWEQYYGFRFNTGSSARNASRPIGTVIPTRPPNP